VNIFRWHKLFLIVLLGLAVAGAGSSAWAAQPYFMKVGSGFAGTYPVFCGKLVELINKQIPGVKASAQPGGTEATMVRIQKGEMQMGIGYTFLSKMVSDGKGALKTPAPKLRHLMSLYGSVLQVAASKKSQVSSLADAGKKPLRVFASKPGSVFYPLIETAFAAYGVTFKDIKKAGGLPNPMGYRDLVRMMQDGMLDVGFFSGPVPYSLILEVEKSPGIDFIGFSQEALDKYNQLLPGTGQETIKAGAYESLKEDIKSVFIMNHLYVSADMPDEIAYQICQVIDKNLPVLKKLFAGAETISPANGLKYNPIEVHPGALKYYQEKGIK